MPSVKRRASFLLLLLTSLFFSLPSFAATTAELFSKIEEKKLYADIRWRKLLFYTPKPFSSPRSIFDTPGTFLSPDGMRDPQKEMIALAAAIVLPVEDFPDPEKHALCRFPARSKFLIKELGLAPDTLPQPECKLVEQWKERNKIDRVSLVFSSYFTNNPASLFGHTFLQLHKGKDASSGSKLLDLAVNYAAHPPEDAVGLFYYLEGAFGKFPGQYDVMPFYVKIQEYNNYEQRDLWHYELNFNNEDLERLIDILWELEHAAAGYFYFDDNCSLVILMTLDAAKPNLQLYESLSHPWIIPVDTLKAVTDTPGLVRAIDYTPSTRTKFLERYQQLNDDEKNLVKRIISDNSLLGATKDLNALASPTSKAKVLDTVVELLDFKDDIAGSDLGKTYKTLRMEILSQRSQISAKPETISPRRDDEAPHLGHRSSRFGLGYRGGSEQSIDAEWRPAFHDLLDNAKGFPSGLQIEFMNTKLRYRLDEKDLTLKDFTLIKIMSLPTMDPIIRSPAWTLGVGGRQDTNCGSEGTDTCLVHYAGGGIGETVVFFREHLVLYAMLRADILAISDGYDQFAIEPGITLGSIARLGQTTGLHMSVLPSKRFTSERQRIFHEAKVELSQALGKRFALRLDATYLGDENVSVGLKAQFYQ